MNHDEHDELWELLGRAKQPAVSPFFSRNVLREIRAQRQESAGVFAWLFRRWQVAAIGVCTLVVATAGVWHEAGQRQDITKLARELSTSPDYAVIGHLDELLAFEENSVWLDDPTF